jgi:hypothetical protein
MTMGKSFMSKTLAVGAAIAATAIIAPSVASAQSWVSEDINAGPAAIVEAPAAAADTVVGVPPAYYPAYPGYPVAADYDDTYVYAGPPAVTRFYSGPPVMMRVAAMSGPDPNWIAYCANKYRTFDPNTGTFTGFDGAQHPCR